jgi:serine/threonine protein kinase
VGGTLIKDLGPDDPESVGPYRLVGRLGAGGMGQVYLGRSPGGRTVAIKVIRPEVAEDEQFRTRFAHEVAAARNVSAIFTAAVVDAAPEAETPWMATVYVPGPSLTEAVEAEGALPAQTVLALAAGLAEGLQAIHAAGLVHRDLKPSNVLLAHDGPRVIDFGISRAVERSIMTQTGMVMGSPGFLSPEQAMGQVVGPASDVFSLGAVLTFAASGNGPFGEGPTPTLMFRVVHQPPDLSGAPDELRPLIEACLAKDPEDRPTASQLLERIGGGTLGDGEWLPSAVTATLAKYVPSSLSAWTLSPPAPATSIPATSIPATSAPATSAPATSVLGGAKPAAAVQEPEAIASPITGATGTEPAGTASPDAAAVSQVSPGAVPTGTVVSGITGATSTVPGPDQGSPPRRRGRFGRRLRRFAITVLVVLVLLVGGGLYGGWRYLQGEYYVGAQDGNVTIFRGVDQTLAGYSLSNVITRSDLPVSQLAVGSQAALRRTITAGSLAAATSVVSQLQGTVSTCRQQWAALAAWQAAEARYTSQLSAYTAEVKAYTAEVKAYKAAVKKEKKVKTRKAVKAPIPSASPAPPAPPTPPTGKPGAQPLAPAAATCAPASAFGIK